MSDIHASSATAHSLEFHELQPVLTGTSAAVHQARKRTSFYRPATITTVSPSRDIVTIRDDAELEGEDYGATLIAPTSVMVGDRVMVHYCPPHGAFVVGILRGGYMPWQQVYVGDGEPGSFQGGWTNEIGSADVLDTDSFAFCAYRRFQGMVELRGRVVRISGVNGTVFNLPDGFRPRNDLMIPVLVGPTSAPVMGIIQIFRSGSVNSIAGNVDTGTNGMIQFDGIQYTVE